MEFEIKNRRCVCTNDIKLVGDNDDYTAVFSFDNEWNNVTKTARFISDRGYHDVILSNDSCTIPALKESITKVGVYSSHMATTPCKVYIAPSIKEGSEPATVSADVYSQLVDRLDSIEAGTVSDERLSSAIDDYFDEHPVPSSGGSGALAGTFEIVNGELIYTYSEDDATFEIVNGNLIMTY